MVKLTITVLFLVTVLLSANVSSQSALPDTVVVAAVNGETITVAEFMFHAKAMRSTVIQVVRLKYGTEYSTDFWSRDINGKTPMEILKQKTMDTIVSVKVQQKSAKKAGIVPDISFGRFEEDLVKENNRRLAAKRAGQVIYGPVQYSREVYYNYLFTNMVNDLKEHLATTDFGINDEKLREAYETGKDSLFRRGYYTVARLFEAGSVVDTARNDPDKISGPAVTRYVFNDSIASPEDEDELQSFVKEVARKLSRGKSSPLTDYRGRKYIVCVDEKTDLGFRTFDQCKPVVKLLLINQLYITYVGSLVHRADVKVNRIIYDQIQL
jgi:hypothetical protein